VFDVQTFSMIIISILCAVIAVIVFRDPRDDGSELIVSSKPLERRKVIFIKFLIYTLYMLIVIVSSMILALFLMCFGDKSQSNPNGFDFDKLGPLEGTLFIGSAITALLFASIAVIISIFGSKVSIMVGVIGISIVLDIIAFVMPYIALSPSNYLSQNKDISMVTTRYSTLPDEQNDYEAEFTNGVYADTKAGNTYQLYQEAISKSGSLVGSYLDVATQLSSIYNMFGIVDQQSYETQYFGSSSHTNYRIDQKDNITNLTGANVDLFMLPVIHNVTDIQSV